VLAGKAEAVGTNTQLNEDGTFTMVAGKCSVDGIKCDLVEGVPTNQIAEVEESAEGAKHLWRYMAFDSREVNLEIC
jgi:hypothetical protein